MVALMNCPGISQRAAVYSGAGIRDLRNAIARAVRPPVPALAYTEGYRLALARDEVTAQCSGDVVYESLPSCPRGDADPIWPVARVSRRRRFEDAR